MMFETLEGRTLFSSYTVDLGELVLAPDPTGPTPPKDPGGAVVVPPGGGVLDPGDADPNVKPDGSTVLVGGTLYVMGTEAPDAIDVSPWYLQIKVKRGSLDVRSFNAWDVKRVAIYGFGGSDVLFVNPLLNVPVTGVGGYGDDFLTGGLQKDYLEGGPGNDNINGGHGNDALNGGDGHDTMFGDLGNDVLSGYAGNDTLDGGKGDDTLYGMDGNDTEFAGLGTDTLYGGNGDDLLVSIFGGVDKLNGDQGWDTFVMDSKDTRSDMDSLATTRKSVFELDKFANGTNGYGTASATELGAVNIADPKLTSRAKKYANFSHVPLFTSMGPRMGDVQQNQLNDCWLATTAASVAESTPWVIKRTVMPLGDGTFAVAVGGQVYRVDADLPVGDSSSTPVYGSVEGRNGSSLWFGLLEKGLAYHMRSGGSYSYGDVESDTPGTAYNALGVSYDKSTLVPFGTDESLMWDKIRINAGKAMTITTEPAALGVNGALRPSHAYSVIRTFRQGNGTKMVVLRNPTDKNGQDNEADGFVTVSASTLYSSCLLLYIAK